jgi:hypothetical protein
VWPLPCCACCCRDERFLLKSVTRAEARKLLSLLPSYTQHMARYPSSLLLRFYGMHRVACTGGRKVRRCCATTQCNFCTPRWHKSVLLCLHRVACIGGWKVCL